MTLKKNISLRLAELIARTAQEKKARDVVVLDLRKLDSITDYFVICTGDVDQHVKAIADHIVEGVRKKTGERLFHREGGTILNWVLLDYIDVVVHIFKPASREFYRLDDLWGDAAMVEWDGSTSAIKKAQATRAKIPVRKSRAVAVKKSPVKKSALDKIAKPPTKKPVVKKSVQTKTPTKKRAKTVRPAVSTRKLKSESS